MVDKTKYIYHNRGCYVKLITFSGVNIMNNDLRIANSVKAEPIGVIADKLGIEDEYLIPYGKSIAKVSLEML